MADSQDEFHSCNDSSPATDGSENAFEEANCEILTTNRNGVKLVYDGFLFYKDKKVGQLINYTTNVVYK